MKQITLNIGGEDRVFYFGLGFLGNLLDVENIQFHEIDEKLKENPFKWTYLIMYHSVSFGFIKKNEEVPFSKFDVSEWIDNCEDYQQRELEYQNKETGSVEKIIQNVKVPVASFFDAFRESLVKDVPEQKKKTEKATTK